MTYPEAVFCNIGEYKNKLGSRLTEEYFAVNSLYTVMFALESPVHDREAAKLPGRVKAIEGRPDIGAHFLKIALLDKDLQPTHTAEGYFADGLWMDVADQVRIKSSDEQSYIPGEAYVSSYEDIVSSNDPRLDTTRRVPISPMLLP